MGTTGLLVGGVGMAAGALALGQLASQGPTAAKPWTPQGRHERVVALSQNYTVRLLDASAWTGMAVGGLAMAVAGGPAALLPGLSSGTWGVLQALTLASSAGSVAAMMSLLCNNGILQQGQ